MSHDHVDVDAFRQARSEANDKILSQHHLGVKRFFNLDSRAYEDGALSSRTKEWMGLVASCVLRCNDCIAYHLDELITEHGAQPDEVMDALNVALVVGGSIFIPHMRTAWEVALQLFEEQGVEVDAEFEPDQA
jgi:AhpD family alkylhydroperoxidase